MPHQGSNAFSEVRAQLCREGVHGVPTPPGLIGAQSPRHGTVVLYCKPWIPSRSVHTTVQQRATDDLQIFAYLESSLLDDTRSVLSGPLLRRFWVQITQYLIFAGVGCSHDTIMITSVLYVSGHGVSRTYGRAALLAHAPTSIRHIAFRISSGIEGTKHVELSRNTMALSSGSVLASSVHDGVKTAGSTIAGDTLHKMMLVQNPLSQANRREMKHPWQWIAVDPSAVALHYRAALLLYLSVDSMPTHGLFTHNSTRTVFGDIVVSWA